MYYKCHKINSNHGGSYTDSPDWIKNKKATVNSINQDDNKCFQHSVTAALYYVEMKNDLQRLTKLQLFLNKCNWQEKKFESEKYYLNKAEKNDLIIFVF